MKGLYLAGVLAIQIVFAYGTSDSSIKTSEPSDRTGRSWHHPASAPQTLQQLQQNKPPVFLQTSTNKPGDNAAASDPNSGGRNFEEQDKSAIPAASEHDFLSRTYGYLNVHRFDPNFNYYDRPQYPRYPSPHTPRFGPGYRKDKYGHGYGYSCKQGDDCDEVRAANQIPPIPPQHPHIPPHHAPLPHHSMPPTPYNSHFGDLQGFSNLPPFPGQASFPPYSAGGLYPPPPPARFNDLNMPMLHQMPPRFYHGRYLHDQKDTKEGSESSSDTKKE